MVTIKISSRYGDFKEWKNKLSATIYITQYPGKYETKENAHFGLILMIKKRAQGGKNPDISLILHNKLTKLDMDDKL